MIAILLLGLLFLLGVASVLGRTVDSRDTDHPVDSLVDYAARRRTRY